MIRTDLKAAGIDYIDEAGKVADFHSLWHTYITNIVKCGASPKIAQQLARHSKITLTMDTYTHLNLFDHSKAMDNLPDLPGMLKNTPPGAEKSSNLRTGTDNQPVSAYKPAYKKLTKNADSGCNQSSIFGTTKGCEIFENAKIVDADNSIQMVQLGQKNNPLSSFDNSGF